MLLPTTQPSPASLTLSPEEPLARFLPARKLVVSQHRLVIPQSQEESNDGGTASRDDEHDALEARVEEIHSVARRLKRRLERRIDFIEAHKMVGLEARFIKGKVCA
jgi:hypothetical protein